MLGIENNILWGKGTQRNEEIVNAWRSLHSSVSSKLGLQLSEADQLNARLSEHPHDRDAWQRLVENAERSGNLVQIRYAFDRLLKHYPNTTSAQIRYLGHLVNGSSTVGEAEELFSQWLKSSPSVDLWLFYLFICKHTNVTPETRNNLRNAYEFALTYVGQDKDSGEIWKDYLQFLKAGEATTTWEEGQKVDAIRKVYQQAVQIPLENVEELWQDMQKFENDLNSITAKQFIAELSPAHMQACSALCQLKNHLNSLDLRSLSNAPFLLEVILPGEPEFLPAERQLLGRWRNYLKWEESNPLKLDNSQRTTLIARIQLAYYKALIQMRFYPEIWYMAYDWLVSVEKAEEGLATLKAGWDAMPHSYLLTFAYAEAMEEKHQYDLVNSIYDTFLSELRKNLEYLDANAKAEEAANLLRSPSSGLTADGGVPGPGEQLPSQSQQSQCLGLLYKSDGDGPAKAKTLYLEVHKYEYGLAIIMYLRFARRAEGVEKHRAAFERFRRDQYCPWQVYKASALVEYYNASGDTTDRENIQIASGIFEKGLELFANEVEYVLSYLEFLISINQKNDARALFERVIETFPPERAKPIWERWAHYEYQYGDLESSRNLDRRLAEVYANDHPIKRFSICHSYLGIDPIASRDLGAAMAAKKPSNNSGATLCSKAETQPSNNSGATSHSKTETKPSNNLSSALHSKAETQTSLAANNLPLSQPISSQKHPLSLDHRYGKGLDDRATGSEYGSGHKYPRLMSTSHRSNQRNCQDRDHYNHRDGPSHRRFSPLSGRDWERNYNTRRSQREEERGRHAAQVPQILSWFVGELPNPKTFNGPILCVDDLMNLIRNAIIPSSGFQRTRSPLHCQSPEYGSYQGPGSGRRWH